MPLFFFYQNDHIKNSNMSQYHKEVSIIAYIIGIYFALE